METEFNKLVSQGYTEEEAQLVLHIAETARQERSRALRTGVCACGRRLMVIADTMECYGCESAYAA